MWKNSLQNIVDHELNLYYIHKFAYATRKKFTANVANYYREGMY
jgi:hypothetical protein